MTHSTESPPDGVLYELRFSPALHQDPARAQARARRRKADRVVTALSPSCVISGFFLPPVDRGLRGLRAVVGAQTFAARRKHPRPDVVQMRPDHPLAAESGFSVEVKLKRGWNEVRLEFKDESRSWRAFSVCHVKLPIFWGWMSRGGDVPGSGYAAWAARHATPSGADLEAMRHHVDKLPHRPLISVLLPVHDTPEPWLRRAVGSVTGQVYPDWELCIANDGSTAPHVRRILDEAAAHEPRIKVCHRAQNGHICAASNSALEMCRGEFTALLDHDDELTPDALFHMAAEIGRHPDVSLLFSDEDKIDRHGERSDPYFKPGWNHDLQLAENYVGHLAVFRTALLRGLGGFRHGFEGSQDWDLVLRVAAAVPRDAIRHVPRVLYHWRLLPESTATKAGVKPYASSAGRNAVACHLRAIHPGAVLRDLPGGGWQVLWPLPDPAPLVSIIIPTRDRVDLLRVAIESLIATTTYTAREILIVDDDSAEPETAAYFAEAARRHPELRVLRGPGGPFNWSALNNLAAAEARGEILLFLNNDVEIIESGWLEELCRQCLRPEVGAVGALLLYPDGTIQHAGVVLGMGGIADHVFAGLPPGTPTVGGRPYQTREVSAVTGACLAVRRDIFRECGGFDAGELAVACNDIDFCLKLRQRGLRNIFTPFARLIHHESASRKAREAHPDRKSGAAAECAVMLQRWGAGIARDPFFNPNLDLQSVIPTPGVPRLEKFWAGA